MQRLGLKASLVTIMKLIACWVGCFGLLLFMQLSHAQVNDVTSQDSVKDKQRLANTEAVKPTVSAHDTVLDAIQRLNHLAADYEKKTGKDDRQQFRQAVRKILEPLIGFKVFARRTMAEHYHKASSEQRKEFLEVSKQALLNNYSDSLLAIRDYDVKVLPAKANSNDSLKSTRVYMQIETPGKQRVSVIQSMYFSTQDKMWKVKNVKVAGINIGIILRDSFHRLVTESSGDLDSAINKWGLMLTKI